MWAQQSSKLVLVMGCLRLLFRSVVRAPADQHNKIVLLIGMGVVASAPLGYLMVQSIRLLMVIQAFHGISIFAATPDIVPWWRTLHPLESGVLATWAW